MNELQAWLASFPKEQGSQLIRDLIHEFDIDLDCGVFPVVYPTAWYIHDGLRYQIELKKFFLVGDGGYAYAYAGYLGIAKMLFVYKPFDMTVRHRKQAKAQDNS